MNMNYDDFLDIVSRELRDTAAWPDAAVALQEKLSLSYVAVLSVATDVPIRRLVKQEDAVLSGTPLQGTTSKYPLPDDLFVGRGDAGIIRLKLDGRYMYPYEASNYSSVAGSGTNSVQEGNPLFSVDINGLDLFANGIDNASIDYVPEPTKPTLINYETTDTSLGTQDAQRAAQIVAYHVSGVTIRDNAAAQFHGLLSNEYANLQQSTQE
jgi:hypothetical protein